MVYWFIKNLEKFTSRPRDLSLIVGMVLFDGLSISVHEGFRNDEPFRVFTGSANFTQSAFGDKRREYMVACDALEAYRYYCNVENDTIFCNHAEVEEYIMLYPTHSILDMENKPIGSLSGENIEKISLSLLSENGEVGNR